jgi:hypothetical protein
MVILSIQPKDRRDASVVAARLVGALREVSVKQRLTDESFSDHCRVPDEENIEITR